MSEIELDYHSMASSQPHNLSAQLRESNLAVSHVHFSMSGRGVCPVEANTDVQEAAAWH